MDLAYVHEIVKRKNSVKYLLGRQDLFETIVEAKGIKTNEYKEITGASVLLITRKDRPILVCFDKRTEFVGHFKELCKATGVLTYSTMSETTATLAERTKWSWENILYRYVKTHGCMYFHKSLQFFRALSSKKNTL